MTPVLLIAGVGLVALYFTQPGRSVASFTADLGALVTGSLVLTDTQLAMKGLIESRFAANGLGFLACAAVANAYAESRLDPLVIGDGGRSVGLFQLYDAGAGAGMSTEERQDPTLNTDRIAAIAAAEPDVMSAQGTATHAELARLFAQYVERCAACGWNAGSLELDRRASLVRQIYGDLADVVPS